MHVNTRSIQQASTNAHTRQENAVAAVYTGQRGEARRHHLLVFSHPQLKRIEEQREESWLLSTSLFHQGRWWTRDLAVVGFLVAAEAFLVAGSAAVNFGIKQ